MGKYLVTMWNGHVLTAYYDKGRVLSLDLEKWPEKDELGNIYVANIGQVVKNINSAFVWYEEGKKAYCSLGTKRDPMFQNPKKNRKAAPGDHMIVQIERDAVKTKEPAATTNLSLTGRYVVLDMAKETGLCFSKKTGSRTYREEWREFLKEKGWQCGEDYGLILRTNAYYVEKEVVYREMQKLEEQFQDIVLRGKTRTCYSRLYQAPPTYVRRLRDAREGTVEEIVTDHEELYREISQIFSDYPEMNARLRRYEDRMIPMFSLYALEKAMNQALSERVWLKSGGYLVIQPVEACTVVDVNTGKYDGKKHREETFLKINLEAAEEIAVQIRLRNISGIIIVDFINMEEEEHNEMLMNRLREATAADTSPVTVVDRTKLNLVEITRKIERKPFFCQYREACNNFDTSA